MILGIDYGLHHIGLATSEGEFATPRSPITVRSLADALAKVSSLANDWGITKIVVGLSEGQSKKQALRFGQKLSLLSTLPVHFVDETLTTYESGPDAHSVAAAHILQRFLDGEAEVSVQT